MPTDLLYKGQWNVPRKSPYKCTLPKRRIVIHTHPLTSAVGVEQCSLEADGTHVFEVLIYGQVDGVAVVRVGVRQRQEVCGAHKEVAVECVQAESWRGIEGRREGGKEKGERERGEEEGREGETEGRKTKCKRISRGLLRCAYTYTYMYMHKYYVMYCLVASGVEYW